MPGGRGTGRKSLYLVDEGGWGGVEAMAVGGRGVKGRYLKGVQRLWGPP